MFLLQEKLQTFPDLYLSDSWLLNESPESEGNPLWGSPICPVSLQTSTFDDILSLWDTSVRVPRQTNLFGTKDQVVSGFVVQKSDCVVSWNPFRPGDLVI